MSTMDGMLEMRLRIFADASLGWSLSIRSKYGRGTVWQKATIFMSWTHLSLRDSWQPAGFRAQAGSCFHRSLRPQIVAHCGLRLMARSGLRMEATYVGQIKAPWQRKLTTAPSATSKASTRLE